MTSSTPEASTQNVQATIMKTQELNARVSALFTSRDLLCAEEQHCHNSHQVALRNSEEMSWSHHGPDCQLLLKSFHEGINSSQRFVDSESRRYCIILSESEFIGLKNFQFTRNPRINDDQAPQDKQVYHDVTWRNCLSDAANHALYVQVAHSFKFDSKKDDGRGSYYIFSGILRSSLQGSTSKMIDVQVSITSQSPRQVTKLYIS